MFGPHRLRGPEGCYTIGDLRRLAQQRLPRAIFDFFEQVFDEIEVVLDTIDHIDSPFEPA